MVNASSGYGLQSLRTCGVHARTRCTRSASTACARRCLWHTHVGREHLHGQPRTRAGLRNGTPWWGGTWDVWDVGPARACVSRRARGTCARTRLATPHTARVGQHTHSRCCMTLAVVVVCLMSTLMGATSACGLRLAVVAPCGNDRVAVRAVSAVASCFAPNCVHFWRLRATPEAIA